MPVLRLTISPSRGEPWEGHVDDAISIGRAADNTIRFEHPTVSRYHAVIELCGDSYWVRDLGSTNGTTVNGRTIAFDAALCEGDVIVFGGGGTVHIGEGYVERSVA